MTDPTTDRPDRQEPPEREFPTIMEQMGGVPGIIASSIPVAVFVVVNIIAGLQPALIASIGVAVLVTVWRLVRKEAVQPAISGLLGVGVAAFIASRTGEARGFYLPGLLLSAGLCLAFVVSLIARWPLAGVVWHGINGEGMGWRDDPALRRAYMLATGLWAVVFGARVLVQGLLYDANEETWLGIARLAMGYPLFGLALLGTIWAVRRAHQAHPA